MAGGGDGGRRRKCEARGCVERKLHQITSLQGMRVPGWEAYVMTQRARGILSQLQGHELCSAERGRIKV